MNIDICKLSFENLSMKPRVSEKIRGYLANKYKEIDLLHNHNEEKFIYRYPLVQYKVIKGKPMIIGINEASNIVANIGLIEDKFTLENSDIRFLEKSIIKKKFEFKELDDYIEYEFLTPWIALSQKNVNRYNDSNNIKKEEILKKILIGNIISMCKGLNYTVEEKINCWINLEEREVNLKGIKHKAFIGKFKVNFKIPSYLGLGKAVSKGFGSIIEIR